MRKITRNVGITVLAVGLLAVFVRQADLPAVWAEIVQADLTLIGLAVLTTYLNMALRSVRWRYLLKPIGSVRFMHAFRATMIGFAATNVLPARTGEFLRPYLLARREGFSAAAAFATIVLERVLDLLTVVSLLAAFMLVLDTGTAGRDTAGFRAVEIGGFVAGSLAVVLFAVMFALAGRPEAVSRAALGLRRILPERAAHAIAKIAGLFAEGLAVARNPMHLLASFLWSIPLWLSVALGIWLTSHAFGIPLPFPGTFLVIAMLVVGISVPTPGGVGGFHEAYRLATTAFYDVANDRAVGAAIVLHAVSVVPVIVVGLWYFVREGFHLRSMGSLAETAVEEDKPGEVPVLRPSGR